MGGRGACRDGLDGYPACSLERGRYKGAVGLGGMHWHCQCGNDLFKRRKTGCTARTAGVAAWFLRDQTGLAPERTAMNTETPIGSEGPVDVNVRPVIMTTDFAAW